MWNWPVPKVSQRPKYGNNEITVLIKEYIHDKTDRRILYLRLVDGDTVKEIAGKVGLDDRTVSRRLQKGEREVFSHLPG